MYGNRSENRIRFVEETEEDAKYFQERLKARKDYEGTKEQRVTFNLPGKEGWKPGMSQEVEQNSSIDYKQEHIRLEEAMRRTN